MALFLAAALFSDSRSLSLYSPHLIFFYETTQCESTLRTKTFSSRVFGFTSFEIKAKASFYSVRELNEIHS